MSIYTYWKNLSPQDGTAVINVASGLIRIGQSGEISDSEYEILSESHLLLPGVVGPWTPEEVRFYFQLDGDVYTPSPRSGIIYNWKSSGVETAADLPTVGNAINDATIVFDTGSLVVWDGSTWRSLAVFGSDNTSVPGFPLIITGGDASSSVFIETISGGNAFTTSFAQIIHGGNA